MYERKKPTQAQLDYANDLIQKLGYDPDWYDLEKMTRSQLARLIDELRDETFFCSGCKLCWSVFQMGKAIYRKSGRGVESEG